MTTCTDCNELVRHCTCGMTRAERRVFLPAADPRDTEIARLQAQVAELQRRLDVSEKQADGLLDTGLAHCDKIDALRAQVDALANSLQKLVNWMPRVVPAAGQEDEWEAETNEACAALAAAGR